MADKTAKNPKRQWGAERATAPMSIKHPVPSLRKIVVGRIAIIVTIFAWFMYVITTIMREFIEGDPGSLRYVLEAVSYVAVVTALTFSALMYLLARQGALYRFRDHIRTPRGPLDQHYDGADGHDITVLIPSYKEELDVIAKTVWSAALQEFPSKRIVLLIDDPPNPTNPDDIAQLNAARDLPARIAAALDEPRSRLEHTSAVVHDELEGAETAPRDILSLVAADYGYASEWLETMACEHPLVDHTDAFFVERVLRGLAGDLKLTKIALDGALDQQQSPTPTRLLQLHNRLVRIFSAEIMVFERKAYDSLSHEVNKAMNLNSYIGIMGKRWRIEKTPSGQVLTEVGAHSECDLDIPWTKYLLTLDADSMLLRDYCVRLVHVLEEPGNERIAVIQTPYSSYRGAPSRIERMAGATTDLQHNLHQGMSYYNATFWVGANAVIRRDALEDIVEKQTVGGFEIRTYVQDRTVIEDTESSIDLGTHGWTLLNYPERLSYSATPPDFGSLIVQRRRWANGGLLILPKFARQLRERRYRRDRVLHREIWLRINYMASIAWASAGLVFLLGYPYDSRLLSPWVILAAAPYFLCMASDLKYSGHRRTDIFRIYGFNLVLLAVNIAGVVKSIQQALTNTKIPFARTPKVQDRTAAPGIYVFIPYVIVGFSVLTFIRDYQAENWGNAIFAATNAILCTYAIIAYIGIRASLVDMVLGVVNWLYVPDVPSRRQLKKKEEEERAARRAKGASEPVEWERILYDGDRRLGPDVKRKNDLRRRITPR
ncbi:MAG: glycosyltransferase family 2 protein [Flaviflexus sp.]|uniref:glycosyltransferase family 2 protein n=1 Tax=Flaviflexus sp. TaxID=1969482 RepID=UPI003F8ED87F